MAATRGAEDGMFRVGIMEAGDAAVGAGPKSMRQASYSVSFLRLCWVADGAGKGVRAWVCGGR